MQLRHWQLSQLFHWKPGTYSYSEPLKLRCWEPLDGLGVLHQLALATFQPLLLGTFETLAWEPASWEPWKPGNLSGAAVREKESKERILLFCLKIKSTESTSFVSTSLCDLRAMPSLVCGGGAPIFSRLSCEPGNAPKAQKSFTCRKNCLRLEEEPLQHATVGLPAPREQAHWKALPRLPGRESSTLSAESFNCINAKNLKN